MFAQILWTQFRWTRTMVATLALLTFVAPAAMWRLTDAGTGEAGAAALMSGFANLGSILALLAMLGAFVLAAQPWTIDAATKHVYPLALPLPWTSYVAMRFAAGLLTLLVPTIALWLGSLLAVAMVELPSTLNAYPGTLALRFLLGAALIYAMTFALQYLAGRKSAVVLLVLLLVGLAIGFLLAFTGNVTLLARIGRWVSEWPGPFAVLVSDWKLIDV